jgi:hypothetical protein
MACSRPTVTGTCTATGSSTASSPNESIHDGDAGGYHQKKDEMLMLFQSDGGKNLSNCRKCDGWRNEYEVVGNVMDEGMNNESKNDQ